MKNSKVLIIILLLILTFGNYNNLYAESSGTLSNFETKRSMETSTFSDVKEENWFYSGVKTVFEYDIMAGVGENLFAPNMNLTKAQAITIAARIHAIYNKLQIAESASQPWYQKFYVYAQNNNLLPPDYTSLSDVGTQYITRSEIAYLFAHILSSKDTATVNDLTIPDIDQVGPVYRDSVQTMYSSGIIGGKAGGVFDGNGLATRAETATIIGRIINPFNRLTHDSKYNSEIAGQEGNLQNYSGVFQTGNDVYLVYWDKSFSRYNIAQYNSVTKETNTIYYGNVLKYKSKFNAPRIKAMYNRELYVAEHFFEPKTFDSRSTLKKINLDSYVVSELYFGDYITGLTIYGDELYILTNKENPNWLVSSLEHYIHTILKIDGSKAYTINTGEGSAYRLSSVNNCLYYQANTKIMELDLNSKTERPFLQNVNTLAFYGNIAYYVERSGNVYKVMLNNIRSKKLLYRGNSDTMGNPVDINYFKNALYFNFAWLDRIDKINSKDEWNSVRTKVNHINFGVFDGYFVYTDDRENDYIAPFGSQASAHRDLAAWLFNQDAKTIASDVNGSVDLPDINSEAGTVLSAKDIYAKCSPGVFYIETYDSDSKLLGTGSGFFITEDGKAITNYHVIEGASYVKIVTSDGRVLWADSLLGASTSKDMAILQIPGDGFNYLKIGDASKVEGGQTIYAIGSPLGLENTISQGIISNPKRSIDGQTFFQISAPISPGSSGGSLINEYGEVIGITTGGFINGQNLNLAVPIN